MKLGSVVVLSVLLGCLPVAPARSGNLGTVPRIALPEPHVQFDGAGLPPVLTRIVAVSADTLLALDTRPTRLLRLVTGNAPEVILDAGPGPLELPHSPMYLVSRVPPHGGLLTAGSMLFHTLNELVTIRVTAGGEVQRSSQDRVITSAVVRESGVLASLYTSSDAGVAARLGGTQRIGWFRRVASRQNGPEQWQLAWAREEFEYSGDAVLDLSRSLYTRLLPRDAKTVYVVELVGSPDVRILDDEAQEVGRFAIPRGGIHGTPSNATTIHDHMVATDVLVDARGRLHVLRGVYANEEGEVEQGKEILVFGSDGVLQEHYRTHDQLNCFDLSPDGRSYVAVRAGTMDVLRFDLGERAP